MYDLGIVGGMGPEATAELFRRIVKLTKASCDQEHLSICILNQTKIPDRTLHIVNNDPSPLELLKQTVDELKLIGVKRFIMPCNTAHYFASEVSNRGIQLIDMIETTKDYIRICYGEANICVLSSSGTAKAHVYQGKNLFYPDSNIQNQIMNTITSIKGNTKDIDINRDRLISIMKTIKKNYGDCIFILACTEISTALSDLKLCDIEYVDAMEVLAIQSIIQCGYEVKEEMTNIDLSFFK